MCEQAPCPDRPRTVRNASIESSDAAVAPVEVTRCPEGMAEAQQAATRAYYAPIVKARAGAVVAEYEESPPEDESELMMEHLAGARTHGAVAGGRLGGTGTTAGGAADDP